MLCVRLYAQTNFKYKNASLPVEVRVQDLLSRMTLEEKIAQMRHIHAYSINELNQVKDSADNHPVRTADSFPGSKG